MVFGFSVLCALVSIVAWYVLAAAVGICLPITTMGWLNALVSVIQLIPVSIAGLGTREGSLVLILGSYDIAPAQALGFSLAIFGVAVLFGIAGGLCEGWDLLNGSRHRPRYAPRSRKQ